MGVVNVDGSLPRVPLLDPLDDVGWREALKRGLEVESSDSEEGEEG